jgi:hypothetical protein
MVITASVPTAALSIQLTVASWLNLLSMMLIFTLVPLKLIRVV